MIEALLLCMAVGFVVLLIRSTTRTDTTNPDELLGLFAYKADGDELTPPNKGEKQCVTW